MMIEKNHEPCHCPFSNGPCWEEYCMLWVEWSDGAECAFHAIAVELNQSDEVDSKEGEEDEPQQSTINSE